MASAINPNNIDGAYPIAGQDNDSQGFRDNFTNTRTNFAFAAAEITDLQNKAVLKAALTGSTQTINYAAGPYYTLSTSGSVSIVFTNFSPAGTVSRVRLQISVTSTAHTLTLPAAVSVGTSNIQGYSASVITFNQTGTFEFEFETNDGGATITIIDQNRNLDPIFLPSFETFSANGHVSLTVTNTIITSSANLTGNLLATSAAAGQIKTLIYGNASTGNCLINVVNAGWQASGNGTANLSATGSAATFQYINSKWYCIGNNGVSFT